MRDNNDKVTSIPLGTIFSRGVEPRMRALLGGLQRWRKMWEWPFVAWTSETERRTPFEPGARAENSGMPVILIECPISGREFSTGIIIDKASFDVLREVPARARCPHCGQEHEWRKSNARLAETIPPAEWIENQIGQRG